MKTNTATRRRRRSAPARPRPARPNPRALQQTYVDHTRRLGPDFADDFADIDAWLIDHQPELWQQIHRQDDEQFRLRSLAVSEREYEAALATFLALCQEAERVYYEANPDELSLPLPGEGEAVAVYFRLADGSLHKVSGRGQAG